MCSRGFCCAQEGTACACRTSPEVAAGMQATSLACACAPVVTCVIDTCASANVCMLIDQLAAVRLFAFIDIIVISHPQITSTGQQTPSNLNWLQARLSGTAPRAHPRQRLHDKQHGDAMHTATVHDPAESLALYSSVRVS